MKTSKEYKEVKTSLKCVSEIQVSYKRKLEVENNQVVSSQDIYKLAMKFYDEDVIDYREQVWLIMINSRANVVGFYKVSDGGLNESVVDVRMCFQAALLSNATRIILVHNHPSGSTRPSRQDDELTKSVAEAGKVMRIRLIDHVIVTSDNDYYSYHDEGRL